MTFEPTEKQKLFYMMPFPKKWDDDRGAGKTLGLVSYVCEYAATNEGVTVLIKTEFVASFISTLREYLDMRKHDVYYNSARRIFDFGNKSWIKIVDFEGLSSFYEMNGIEPDFVGYDTCWGVELYDHRGETK